MRILVLGATGLAGAQMMRTLGRAFGSVNGTCRAPGREDGLLSYTLEQGAGLRQLLEKIEPEVVVSCLVGDFSLLLQAHRAAADYLAERGGRMVYLSSANVFDGALEAPHREGDEPRAESVYGQYKIACEALLRERLGERAVILRPSEIWSPDCPRLLDLVRRAETGAPVKIFCGISINYTTARQLAEWTAWILRENLGGIFHVATQDILEHAHFRQALARRLGLPAVAWQETAFPAPCFQAVLPGRAEIPAAMQLSVEAVLDEAAGKTGKNMPKKLK